MVTITVAPQRVSVMRSVVESLLLRLDFSVEATADLMMAITEICEQIVDRSSRYRPVTCSVVVGPDAADGEVRGVIDALLPRFGQGIGWHLVQAAVDRVDVATEICSEGRDVTVSFRKLRESA
ncbi:ATP-binding protein [Williamsia deligens]|uniref:Serine/threonine-protein kinase RsbW n=1 Tax=Williamsia deligens TaxID=321325 RepID=A0ABW3G8C5_9NOCA|nr:hypothetical protein [Williamsia deligens]